jgi:hypothetical protein
LLFCKRNESFAALQTQASFAVAKLMLNLHKVRILDKFCRILNEVLPLLALLIYLE